MNLEIGGLVRSGDKIEDYDVGYTYLSGDSEAETYSEDFTFFVKLDDSAPLSFKRILFPSSSISLLSFFLNAFNKSFLSITLSSFSISLLEFELSV